MAASDSTVRSIVMVIDQHVERDVLRKIVRDLLGVSGNKSFRDTIMKLSRELKLDG